MLSPCASRRLCWELIAPRLYRSPRFTASSRDRDSGSLVGAPERTLPWNAPCACVEPPGEVTTSEPVCANAETATRNRLNVIREERSHWSRMRIHPILLNLPAAPAVSGSRQHAGSRNGRELSGIAKKDLRGREQASKIHARMYDVKRSDLAMGRGLYLAPA